MDDSKDIYKLAQIFNGRLVLLHRIKQFSLWYSILNLKGFHLHSCQTVPFVPTLEDAWLSGFTDAEGCFNVSIQKRKETNTGYRVILRFILDQKNAESLLLAVGQLFEFGSVALRSKTNNVYRFTINSFIGLKPVLLYFRKYPLKTKKFTSFTIWLDIYNRVLNKEHLNSSGFNKIQTLSKTINLNNSLTSKTGSSLKKKD